METLSNFARSQFFRFIVVGVINTLNYYLLYLFLVRVLSAPYLVAHLGAFATAFIISYFLNCYFVYHVKPTWLKLLKFPITQVFNFFAQAVILFIAVDIFNWSASIAPLLAVVITVPITFWITRVILVDKAPSKQS